MEAVGGAAYYRNLPLERMWRDVQASHYHPLPEKKQYLFSARYRLGQEVFGACDFAGVPQERPHRSA